MRIRPHSSILKIGTYPNVKRLPFEEPYFILIFQATDGNYEYAIFYSLSILWAKLLINNELSKFLGNFSVVCGDFVRLFVVILFGRL